MLPPFESNPVDPTDNPPEMEPTPLSTSSGIVWSYKVTPFGLRLVLKNEKHLVYTLANTAFHYPSVLSMIITAAVRDEEVSVGTPLNRLDESSEKPIVNFGLGTEPVF